MSLSDKQSNTVFTATADETQSRLERYQELFDIYVAAPFRIIWAYPRARFGLLIVLFYVLMGTVGVTIIEPPRAYESSERLLAPFVSLEYPLGTTNQGDDIFAQIVHATPAMLKMIIAGALFTTIVASIIGMISGYKGGILDSTLMFITDIFLVLPGLPLIIVIAVLFEPRNPFLVGIFLAINNWSGLARALRSEVLSLREESYVEASRAMGLNFPTIIVDDIVPNVLPYIMVNFVTSARQIVLSSVALYFLGILPFSTLNWGVMMNMAYSGAGAIYTPSAIHWFFAPMGAIVLLSLGLILLGQGTDRLFNPRIRAKHSKVIAEDSSSPE